MSLTTEEKGLRMTGEELKAKIAREERSYERAVLRQRREDRRNRRVQREE